MVLAFQIEFMTERQNTTLYFNGVGPFWEEPVWKFDKWEFSIPRAKSVNSGIFATPTNMYAIGSTMRGKYMKVKITCTASSLMAIKQFITKILE